MSSTRAASTQKFSFGIDYSKKSEPAATTPGSRPAPGRISANKYTPTAVTNRPKSSQFTPTSRIGGGSSNAPGRFGGVEREPKPALSSGASMREALEKERANKLKDENKVKEAEERKKRMEEYKKKEEERKKVEEEEKKKKEAEEAKRKEEEGGEEEESDSQKMKKNVPACQKKREKKPARRTMSISNIVMDWVQEMTKDYDGVEIKNFSTSWNNGLAFCALIHRFNPDEFDFNELKAENKRYNFDLAFNTGSKCKNIPILLDTEDMVRMKKPEPRSVQTYIQWIWSVYGPTSGYGPTPKEVQEATLG